MVSEKMNLKKRGELHVKWVGAWGAEMWALGSRVGLTVWRGESEVGISSRRMLPRHCWQAITGWRANQITHCCEEQARAAKHELARSLAVPL